MTPHRSRGRGTPFLDRRWHGVRIYRAAGTHDVDVVRAIDRALTDLKRSDDVGLSTRLAIWGELAAGDLPPLRFLEQVRRFGLAGLRAGATRQDLKATIAHWFAVGPTSRQGRPLAASTIASYRIHLEQHVLTRAAGATVEELPAVVRRIRDEASPGTAYVVRNAALAFVRWLAGRHSELWRQVADVTPPAVAQHERVGLPLAEAREKAVELGLDGAAWWTLCTTGMRVKREYLANVWTVGEGHIEIRESKTSAGRRLIPLLATPVRWPMSYTPLAQRLQKVGLMAHIARYTYDHWLQEAGIPPARVKLYMGHQLSGLALYGRHEVLSYIPGDRARLIEFIGPAPSLLRAVRP